MIREEVNIRLAKLLSKADADVEKILKEFEPNLIRAYKSSLENIKKEIAWIFEKYGAKVTYGQMQAYNRLTGIEKEIAQELKNLTGETVKLTTKKFKETFTEGYYRTAFALEVGTGFKLGFGTLNKSLVEAAILNPLDRLKWTERMGITTETYTRVINQEVATGLNQGTGYVNIARAITDKFGGKGLTEPGLYPRMLRIVQTEGHRVQNAARVTAFDKSERAAELLGVETERVWLHPDGVKEPREDHIKMNDKPANKEGKFILPDGTVTDGPGLTGKPEHDINCFPGYINVNTPTQIKGLTKRYYEGELIEITTVGGIKLAGTPNHPVLTQHGWVALNSLNEGSHIFSAGFRNVMSSRDPNIDNTPIAFREIFNFANIIFPHKRAAIITENFHGDGIIGDVKIITPKGFLRNSLQIIFSKPFFKNSFLFTEFGKSSFFSYRFFMHLLLWYYSTFNRLVSLCVEFLSLTFRKAFPSIDQSFTKITRSDIVLPQNSINNLSADFESLCKSMDRNSLVVKDDNILTINRSVFRGHVYNLETINNYYLVNIDKNNDNMIIAHNCHCTSFLKIKMMPKRGRQINPDVNYTDWFQLRIAAN